MGWILNDLKNNLTIPRIISLDISLTANFILAVTDLKFISVLFFINHLDFGIRIKPDLGMPYRKQNYCMYHCKRMSHESNAGKSNINKINVSTRNALIQKTTAQKLTDLSNPIQTFILYMLLLKNLQFLPNDIESRSK